MNLVLFESHEITGPIPSADPRARHIRTVLRRSTGDSFDCGVVDGPRGRARIARDDRDGMHLDFQWEGTPPPIEPVSLLVGLPRPQTARKILREITALGVARIVFFPTEKGEPSYAGSALWRGCEVRRHLIEGASQAFSTRLPRIDRVDSLSTALLLTTAAKTRLALDNYEASAPLADTPAGASPALLAVGGERGWSATEREMLREAGFTLVHLGQRVLRTETASVAGITVVRARLGLLH